MSEKKPSGATRYRDALRAAITPFADADTDNILSFRREMYGESSIYADPAYLQWMYGPDPSAGPPGLLWLYRKDGEVEGQQGGLRVTLEVRGKPYAALWALDLMVSPKYQLRGIGAVLAETAFESTGLILGTEVSEDARRAFTRAGWVDAATLPLYFRPMDLELLARARWSGGRAAIVGGAGNIALRSIDRALFAALRVGAPRLEQVPEFDERSNRLWQEASPHFPVACRRDAAFLNWRFAKFPADRYRIFYARHRDEVVGHVVLRSGEWNGLPAGFIVDYVCTPRWTKPLMAAALAELRQERLAGVYCLHLNPVSISPLRSLGFLRRDSGWRFMVRSRDLPTEVRSLIEDPHAWFLTAADSDLDRPREGTVFAPTASWNAAEAE
jgi:hypothetical protein